MGNTTKLVSAFYLGYNMLLNLLRMEGGDPEYMIERSFHQFQRDKHILALKEEYDSLTKRIKDYDDICSFVEGDLAVAAAATEGAAVAFDPSKLPFDVNAVLAQFFRETRRLERLQREARDVHMAPMKIAPFLNPGRLVYVVEDASAAAGERVSKSLQVYLECLDEA